MSNLDPKELPPLSGNLTNLQRTLAETYQRVFVNGNRIDDAMILTSLINEVADRKQGEGGAGEDTAELLILVEQLKSDLRSATRVNDEWEKSYHDLRNERLMGITAALTWMGQEYDHAVRYELPSVIRELAIGLTEAKEQAEGKYQALVAVIDKHFGNDPGFATTEDRAEFLDSTIQALKDELASAQLTIENDAPTAEETKPEAVPIPVVEEQAAEVVVPVAVVPSAPSPSEGASVTRIDQTLEQFLDNRSPFIKLDGRAQFLSKNPEEKWVKTTKFDIPAKIAIAFLASRVSGQLTAEDACDMLSIQRDAGKSLLAPYGVFIKRAKDESKPSIINEAVEERSKPYGELHSEGQEAA